MLSRVSSRSLLASPLSNNGFSNLVCQSKLLMTKSPRDLRLSSSSQINRGKAELDSHKGVKSYCNLTCKIERNSWVREFHFTRSANALVSFKLADIGEGIAECEILKWHVNEGDHIQQFQLLCEVQSDKANVEITSRYEGVIQKLYYKKGDMAKVGTNLMDIEVAGAAPSQPSQQSASSTSPSPSNTATTSVNTAGKALATPAVRFLAAKHNLDLTKVTGTGRDGRIQKEDILGFINNQQSAVPTRTQPRVTPTPSPITIPIPSPPPSVPSRVAFQEAVDTVVPLSGYARIMAKTMTLANQIPHFGYNDEVIADKLQEFRAQLKPIAQARGVKLSSMPIIIKATSMALKQYPKLNSSYDEPNNSLIIKGAHNIGVAMDTPNGLVVPNVKNVQNLSIFEIAQELNRLQASAQQATLSKADLSGGTFTLSNIGSIGGTYASPVLVVPEVAIGAIGKIQRLPRFDDQGRVVPVQIFNISWSADHRVIDGATMANFSNLWKQYLENPSVLLFETR